MSIGDSIARLHRLAYHAPMTKDEVLKHFGSQAATAEALRIKQPSVAAWADPLPELRQLEIEQLTNGALRAGAECDKYRVPMKSKRAAKESA